MFLFSAWYISCWYIKDSGVAVVLKAEERMRQALEPPYIQLLSQISKLWGGVKDIVDMRRDLLVRTT